MGFHIASILDKALAGKTLSPEEGCRLLCCGADESDHLLKAAGMLRDRHKGRIITYSRKVFLPVTNLCRNRCSYCAFRREPTDADAWTMVPEDIIECLKRARALGCKEALLCLGDRPEQSFEHYRQILARFGYKSSTQYLFRVSRMVLESGLLPHTNAGVLSFEELKILKDVNASLGLMLETVSERLCGVGMPHFMSPDKAPAARLRMLRDAGKLQIPITTGILIGIGETLKERVESLVALREIHREYGHIQEVIVQNFRAKPGTPMADCPEPGSLEMVTTVAVARLLLGGEMNVQAPPNLFPDDHRLLLKAGINDWGGISPLTADYVNPDNPWPQIGSLMQMCAEEGFCLRERLAVYPEFVARHGFLAPSLKTAVARLASVEPYSTSLQVNPL